MILNFDQTKPSTLKMEVNIYQFTNVDDKNQITVIYCASLPGEFSSIQIIYDGLIDRFLPNIELPNSFHFTHSSNHW